MHRSVTLMEKQQNLNLNTKKSVDKMHFDPFPWRYVVVGVFSQTIHALVVCLICVYTWNYICSSNCCGLCKMSDLIIIGKYLFMLETFNCVVWNKVACSHILITLSLAAEQGTVGKFINTTTFLSLSWFNYDLLSLPATFKSETKIIILSTVKNKPLICLEVIWFFAGLFTFQFHF